MRRLSEYQRDLDKLNELIDWYNKHKPDAGKLLLVRFRTEQLNKFAQHIPGTNQWKYRERILVKVPEGGQHGYQNKTEATPETNSQAGAGARPTASGRS